jgi:hypothetical protein
MAQKRAPQVETGDADVTRASLELSLPVSLLAGVVRRAVQATPAFAFTSADERGAQLIRRSATASDADAVHLVFEETGSGSRISGEVHAPAGTIGVSVKKRDADTTALFDAIATAAGPF